MSGEEEIQEQPKYTQAEADEMLAQLRAQDEYKYACYEAIRAMEAFRSPPYLITALVRWNPHVFPPPKKEGEAE